MLLATKPHTHSQLLNAESSLRVLTPFNILTLSIYHAMERAAEASTSVENGDK